MSYFGRSCSVLLASTVLATAAMAVTPLQTTVTANAAAVTSGLLTVTATGPSLTRSIAGSVAVGDVTVSRFDTTTGILVGARISVNTAVSAMAQVTGTVPASGNDRTITATTSLTGAVATAGVRIAGATLGTSKSCSGGNCANSPGNQQATTTGSIVGASAVPLANLAAYAGPGTVAFTRTASGSTSVTTGAGTTSGTANGLFSFGSATPASNVYSITYDHLNFANPSFIGASTVADTTLDFGTLTRRDGPKTLNFKLFNIGNANSAGLDLLSVTRQTGDASFTTNLSTFTNGLDGGAARDYSAIFAPTTTGKAIEMFTLVFGDHAVGGVGGRLYRLQLFARANVIAAPTGIPEPAAWTMMILGFGFVGTKLRKRPRVVTVLA